MTTSKELSGKVALVTGGARNIGRAIVLELAQAGAHVAILTRRNSHAAAAVADEARRHGAEAETYIADVADEAAVKFAMAEVGSRFGRLDVLVNNAAVRMETPLAQLSLAEWHAVLGVTLDGAFLCTREALPMLSDSGTASIVNIGGLSAHTGAKYRAHVIAAKAGLDGFTRALAVELAPNGITANIVAPGLIDTVRDGATPHHHQTNATLSGRRGHPQDVAGMVRYLAGPQARYITGQTIHVNGGAYFG